MATAQDAAVERLAALLAAWGAGPESELASWLHAELPGGERAAQRLWQRVETTGDTWGFHPADPLAREISRGVLARLFQPPSGIEGIEALADARPGPVLFVGNHVSFVDANAVDALLAGAGHTDVANRLTVVVGPKVYALPLRRLASLAFGCLKIPQSTRRASGDAVMPMREVVRHARQALEQVRERQTAGEHVLIFAEGSRSRSGAMQPVLPGVVRYLEARGTRVIPFGLWGSERLAPIDVDHVAPAPVRLRLGPAFDAASLLRESGRRAAAAEALGARIAELLPPEYRGHYGGSESARAAAP